jgi:Putative transmembrane protein (Alph_Pro_TM).
LENVDNKLFQTRVFFPSNSIPGEYTVTIYQVRDMVIKNKKTKIIKINRSGIGNKIFKYAQEQPGIYGLLVIILAIFSGLIAATAFRRL